MESITIQFPSLSSVDNIDWDDINDVRATAAALKAELELLQEDKKVVLARLMHIHSSKPDCKSAAMQEREARRDPKYADCLAEIRIVSEKLYQVQGWLTDLRVRVDIWQTKQATLREAKRIDSFQNRGNPA